MSEGGKDTNPKPLNVANEDYINRWNAILGKDSEIDKITRNNEETQQVHNLELDSSGKSLL